LIYLKEISYKWGFALDLCEILGLIKAYLGKALENLEIRPI